MRKRELYERFDVPEYWYVDLDAERVEIYRLQQRKYGAPRLAYAGEQLETPMLPGFSVPGREALGAPPNPPQPA